MGIINDSLLWDLNANEVIHFQIFNPRPTGSSPHRATYEFGLFRERG